MAIRYERLNHKNFDSRSLDSFIRHQTVRESWRKIGGTWRLIPNDYEESWDLNRQREIAADIARHMETNQSAFGAFSGEQLVGFITVSHALFGQAARYVQLVCFQVSEPFRGRGIGKRLFALAASEMTVLGADRLYISARWAVSMLRKSTRFWPPRSHSTCRLNISRPRLIERIFFPPIKCRIFSPII